MRQLIPANTTAAAAERIRTMMVGAAHRSHSRVYAASTSVDLAKIESGKGGGVEGGQGQDQRLQQKPQPLDGPV